MRIFQGNDRVRLFQWAQIGGAMQNQNKCKFVSVFNTWYILKRMYNYDKTRDIMYNNQTKK